MMLQILNKLIYNCNVDECLNSLNINHYFWSNKKKSNNEQTNKKRVFDFTRENCMSDVFIWVIL